MNAVIERQAGALTMARGDLVRVLGNSLYPGASMQSIELVLGYCEAAGLDPMQKPVHIVPMYDRDSGRMRDVIMPGVALYRTNAARSGAFAGMTEPEFGPELVEKIGGAEIAFPQWCRVTVKRRLATGEIAEFTAVEYWLENYAIKGGKEKSIAPNAMWTKRPRGQLAKCAQAQALRIAFPELASPMTAEEMEGKPLDPVDVIDAVPEVPAALLQAGKEAADKGLAAYSEWWASIGKEGRQLAQHEHAAWKIRAQEADSTRGAPKGEPAQDQAPQSGSDFVADMERAEAAEQGRAE